MANAAPVATISVSIPTVTAISSELNNCSQKWLR